MIRSRTKSSVVEPGSSAHAPRDIARQLGWAFFLTLAWIPIANNSPYGDLSHWYTDHLHHSFATWVAIKKGLAIYTEQFQTIWSETGWPYPLRSWGNMPGYAYPPGIFVVFVPLVLIGKPGILSPRAFGVCAVLWMLALAAFAFHSVIKALQALPPGSRFATGILAWLILSQLGLQGFFDSAYIACGGYMVAAIRRDKHERALQWFSAASLLHFRSAALIPLAVYAFQHAIRGRRWPEAWPWRTIVVLAASGLICVVTFFLMYPATAGFRAEAVRVLSNPNAQAVVIVISLVTAVILLKAREYLAAATLAIIVGLAELEVQNFWWHGAMVLFVPLSIGIRPGSANQAATWLRGVALFWCLAIHPIVWRDPPGQVFTEFVKFFKT